MENHTVSDKPLAGFWVCKRCGLVYLKNQITQAAIKYGCDYNKHPEFIKLDKQLRQKAREKMIQ